MRETVTVLLLIVAYSLAYLVRFDFGLPDVYRAIGLRTILEVVGVQYVALLIARVHRRSWRFTSLADVLAVTVALLAAQAVLVSARFLPVSVLAALRIEDLARVPLAVIGPGALLAIAMQVGIRALRRLRHEQRIGLRPGRTTTRALLVGAGRVAAGIVRDARLPGARTPEIVGIVTRDRTMVGQMVTGVPVVGLIRDLDIAVRDLDVDVVVIAIDDDDPALVRSLVEQAGGLGVEVRIRPASVLDGATDNVAVRPLEIADLLRRPSADIDVRGLEGLIGGRIIMVTGAGGSIGSELCRQLVRYAPSRLVLFDRGETPLWAIQRELAAIAPHVELSAIIGDVADRGLLDQVLTEKPPAVVFHAAAMKHVPLLETNNGAAVTTNVVGTANLVDACVDSGVPRFVLVSTDKAVEPTSMMGATKRVAERYVQHVAATTGRPYVAVRFGNVLGSAGSVVPVFEQQIAEGGPVTITDPEMTRYFMTIPEACQLIVQAALIGSGGEVLVLDMGEPVSIGDLANDLIRLRGLEPGRDIEVRVTGVRPGEKLHEALTLPEERVDRSLHPSILVARASETNWPEARERVDELHALILAGAYEAARRETFGLAGADTASRGV